MIVSDNTWLSLCCQCELVAVSTLMFCVISSPSFFSTASEYFYSWYNFEAENFGYDLDLWYIQVPFHEFKR